MDPAEHPSAGCMTGWGLTPARGIVSSSLFSSGPVRFREAGTRACGAGCGRSRPFLLPVAWSAGEVPVSFGSWPWPARQQPPSTTRQVRSGLIDGRSRPRDRSVMRARALTGAARSGCGRPGDESSGHHQTERLAGLDEAEQRGGGSRAACLAIRFCIGRCRTDHQTTAAERGLPGGSYDLPTQDRKVEARPAVLPWPGWRQGRPPAAPIQTASAPA